MRTANFLFTFGEMSASVADSTFQKISTAFLTSSSEIANVENAEDTLNVLALDGPNNRCPTWDELIASAGDPYTVYVTSTLFGKTISAISNIPGFNFTSSVSAGGSVKGIHTGFASVNIFVQLTGTNTVDGNLTFSRNSVPVSWHNIPADSGGNTYGFYGMSASINDVVRISGNLGFV